jgi:hypothetical protein
MKKAASKKMVNNHMGLVNFLFLPGVSFIGHISFLVFHQLDCLMVCARQLFKSLAELVALHSPPFNESFDIKKGPPAGFGEPIDTLTTQWYFSYHLSVPHGPSGFSKPSTLTRQSLVLGFFLSVSRFLFRAVYICCLPSYGNIQPSDIETRSPQSSSSETLSAIRML